MEEFEIKNKIKRFLEYSRTAENTSNRRIQITSNILKINLINPLFSLIAIILQKELNLNKVYIIIFVLFVFILSILLTIAMLNNYKNSKKLNEAKYKIIIKYEKELFGNSFYDEEYKYYLNLKNNGVMWKKLSFVELIFCWISLLVMVFIFIFIIIFIILLFC